MPPELLGRWVGWFAPAEQPFLLPAELDGAAGLRADPRPLPDELRDTYWIYGDDADLPRVWLSEQEFLALERPTRIALLAAQRRLGRELVPSVRGYRHQLGDTARGQGDGHRFVWWPSLIAGHEQAVLREYIEEGRRPSRHDEVTETTWRQAQSLLPGARELAGTFPRASGPNCFGAVMAAAGVPGAATEWMQREPFEQWLSDATLPGGTDDRLGTVMVWRSPDGLVQHAAVALGDGWVLHKPSQGWMSPVKVLTADDAKRSARAAGRRLQRYRMTH
ncbi:hypothetical protein [Angustibacter sp. Root456]|uniref:hypothetical protein n=1 Tax=Angustibacter sp. Root456 TaxID=1736539 RepID=UPI0006FDA340|nr:hypothetical protein [Angustibacter sp. Root456]KQX66256.1 hypothetical protein ASD06_07810 [Angustibacter sp. Root456]